VYVVRFDDGIWTTSASAIAAFRPILIANESASDAGGLGLIMWLDAFVDSNNQEVEELKIVRILPNGNLSNAFAAPDTLFVPVEPQTAWIDDAGTAYVMMTNQGSVRVESIRADGTYVAGAILSNRPALLSRMVGLGDGTKLVVWSEPKAIGFAAALKSYVIGSDLASGRNTIVESVASDGYAFDLSANVEAFTVFSSDLSGENAGLASLEFLPPSSPQNVTIKRTGATTAQVEWATTWTDPETFTVALVGGGFNVSQQTSSKSVSLANLNPAVTYTVSVVSSSNGKQSAPTSVTLKAVRPAVAPAAISIKPVKVKNQKQFKVEWKKPGNLGGSAVVRYEVQVKIGTSAWKPLAKLAPTKYAFTTTKLSAGKNYQFRVRAVTYVNGVFKTSKTVKA
jgi:hypothetical protein